MKLTFDPKSFSDLMDTVKALNGATVAGDYIMSSLQKGARAIVTKARVLSPKVTNQLAASIRVKGYKPRKAGEGPAVVIGPSKRILERFGKKYIPGRIAHCVEGGHKIAATGGKVKPYPFLKPAVNSSMGAFLAGVRSGLEESIAKIIQRRAKS